MKKATKVRPEQWYNMQDIVRDRLFPWVSNVATVRKIVAQDQQKKNVLRATVIGTGRATKYHFKGENIIKFIKEVESGKSQL